MTTAATASVLHLLGYIASTAIYLTLLATVWQSARASKETRLPLATALLGLVWNLWSLASFGHKDFGSIETSPMADAIAFTALGFLPAVVVHSVLRADPEQTGSGSRVVLTVIAYVLSAAAGVTHFAWAFLVGYAPSPTALHLLTPSFGALIVPLVLLTRGEPRGRRALWVVALAMFSLSGPHLAYHTWRGSWPAELVADHASLLLALAILYQDYRFALADLFLKRALTLLAMAALVLGTYAVASPLQARAPFGADAAPPVTGLILGLVAALVYPSLRRAAAWTVDTLVVRREPHARVRAEITDLINRAETVPALLDATCTRLGSAFNASTVRWRVLDGSSEPVGVGRDPLLLGAVRALESSRSGETARIVSGRTAAVVLVATADMPRYGLMIDGVSEGRRMSAADVALLESIGLLLARRIDALRITQERFTQQLREQEARTLAAEAELTALRAQINPHFLFNALNTIGHLIQSAPERALDTLLDLTDLLRRVLRSEDRFTTLGRELEVIQSYLDIERARFEERLEVVLEVPAGLHAQSVPPLLMLPLVENAIKHGIARAIGGGTVTVSARLEGSLLADRSRPTLLIMVGDTGPDATAERVDRDWRTGVGIRNLERRLQMYYGDAASFTIRHAPGSGTMVEVRLPASMPDRAENNASGPPVVAEPRRAIG